MPNMGRLRPIQILTFFKYISDTDDDIENFFCESLEDVISVEYLEGQNLQPTG